MSTLLSSHLMSPKIIKGLYKYLYIHDWEKNWIFLFFFPPFFFSFPKSIMGLTVILVLCGWNEIYETLFRNAGLVNSKILGNVLNLGTTLGDLIWPCLMCLSICQHVLLMAFHRRLSRVTEIQTELHPQNTMINNSVDGTMLLTQKGWVDRTVVALCSLTSVQWTKFPTSFTLALKLSIICKLKHFYFLFFGRTSSYQISFNLTLSQHWYL